MWFNGEYSMTSRCARLCACACACARVRVVWSLFVAPRLHVVVQGRDWFTREGVVANLVFAFVQIVNAGSEFVDQGSF